MPNNQYPDPPQPYSLQQITLKILSDCDYAQFIHDQVAQARNGDSEAIRTVDANFQPQTAELDALHIPAPDQPAYARCTDPKTHLIAFVGYVQTVH
jgi:hypothetical protein